GFISDGYLYQSFAFHDDPIMRIVDLNNFTVLYEDHVGPYGYYDEYENIGTYNNRIYAFGIKALSVFEFKFNIDHYS
ncbi:MAG: hypothetical protein K6F07_02100, partial [Bacilli bacterium]|nr:hypothetical protein [Bacilli bacterium]